jgi:hypothetical protein
MSFSPPKIELVWFAMKIYHAKDLESKSRTKKCEKLVSYCNNKSNNSQSYGLLKL